MASNNNAKKIEMLLLEGTPSGLRYIDLRNWVGRAFVCPRASISDLLKRDELEKSGVYFLYGVSDTKELPDVYVGEADVLKNRLPHHGSKEFWTDVIVFTAQDELLDKAGIRYLESRIVRNLQEDNLCNLTNGNTPEIKNVSEADQAVLEEYFEKIKLILLVLGYKIFRYKDSKKDAKSDTLYLSTNNVSATGKYTDEGFVIYKDSQSSLDVADDLSNKFKDLKKELVEKGVLVKSGDIYVFTKEQLFTSPSYASSMVLGYRSNGRHLWKNKEGKTINDIQEKELAD